MASDPRVIEGQKFDAPLIFDGAVGAEPQSYIAERPYELTKFELSILRRPDTLDWWFTLLMGATFGLLIAIVGKLLAALIDHKPPTVETWELCGLGAGAVICALVAVCRKLRDPERTQLLKVIDGHFDSNRPRRVHLTNRGPL